MPADSSHVVRHLTGELIADFAGSETYPLDEAIQLEDVVTQLKEWGLSQLAGSRGVLVGQIEGKTLYLTADGKFRLQVADLDLPIDAQHSIEIFGFHAINEALGEAIIARLQSCRANNEYWAELSKRAEGLLKAI